MITILSSFCIVACFLTGIYGAIISYHFRNTKRTIWFSILCVSFGLYIITGIGFTPLELMNPEYTNDLQCHIFLAVNVLVIMCLHIYSGLLFPNRHPRLHTILNYSLFVLAALCLLVPGSLCLQMYIVVSIFGFYAYGFSIYFTILKILEGDKTYIYPVVGYCILLFSTIAGYIFLFLGYRSFSPRIFAVPLFIILNIIMTLRQYSLSVEKTKQLSSSLSETIEKINHSDTALMCTQMKADFLYKSLDLISQKCDEDPFTAEDLTVSLSKYLRHTLNFQQLKGIVPLTNEIELTKAFVAIEKERYPQLSVEYRFPDPLPELHVPPLSIQPLVENAIEHGFDGSEESQKITITIIPYREYFHIDISDNGKGMDEEMVTRLTDALCDSARIGIYNIHTRLIGLFGKGLVIQSAPGVGSSVSFVVPPNAMSIYEEKEGATE